MYLFNVFSSFAKPSSRWHSANVVGGYCSLASTATCATIDSIGAAAEKCRRSVVSSIKSWNDGITAKTVIRMPVGHDTAIRDGKHLFNCNKHTENWSHSYQIPFTRTER